MNFRTSAVCFQNHTRLNYTIKCEYVSVIVRLAFFDKILKFNYNKIYYNFASSPFLCSLMSA